ncbi:baseplate J/gp47 family protein [Sorangium cellulosum]|uniref:Uncharacterized protein n=1 Tax=Sorangium cellulosum So0157-2 TaxID=1254432 RepID=S4YF35_SORCE|nr:baseplate J/gp47 family protein [Sorangium cellulosum]AGP41498.1 hypothetical protein SCE1572_47650 [Sorangium cellulosum So0157-2]
MSAPWLVWSEPEAQAGLQGIDYVELALLPTPEAPVEADLILHLQEAWPGSFTEKSLSLTGGRRVTDLAFSLVAEDPVARTVTLKIHGIGDASDYTVTLLDGAGLPVHPFFASSVFVFTVDCERGDCRPLAEEAPRPPRQRPAIDLSTKDYAGFMALLAGWVRVKNPHWADLASASLERVLVELLAHHGDLLSYYQDRVAAEAFLDTASQRYSLRQHATLLGTQLFDGTAAETVLAFSSAGDGYIPEGVEVTTPEGIGDAEVTFYLTERTRALAAHNHLPLAAWPGAAGASVPAGATELLLWGEVRGLLPGQKIAIVQGAFFGLVPFSQVVSITSVRHDELPGWVASPSGAPHTGLSRVTVVAIDPPLERAVRPWDAALGCRIYGNLGPARFGKRSTPHISEIRLVERELRDDRHNYVIERRPGFTRSILRALRLPEGPVVFEAQRTAAGVLTSRPILEVAIGGEPWERVEHLHNAQSYDRHYVATADEDGSLWLELGDGAHGKAVELLADTEPMPLSPPALRLDYRIGAPIAGNVGAGVLTRFVPGQTALAGLAGLEVVNVLPGTGGRQPETRDAARLRVPASLRNGPMERAVSLADYADGARSVPGVARAAARLLGGPFNAVLVLVDPVGQSGLTEALERAVFARIDALRMAGREHFVSAPDYVPVEVALALCVEPGALPHRVRDAVLAALLPGRDESPGFFHPDRLSFGEELELGDVLAAVQGVPGVRSVKALRFRKLKVASSGPVEARIALGPTEVIRMDGDAGYPENGKLRVLVVGVDPGVTETDFIIEEAS